jgi:translocation protein SEC63
MSGFKETFTKEEGGEKNLDYDDSAFYYFAGVIEIVVLIPLLYYFVKTRVLGYIATEKSSISSLQADSKHCKCSLCVEKLKNYKKPGKANRLGLGFILHLSIILLLGYLLYITIVAILDSPTGIKRFDPYELLGIEIGATEKQIRSAFREMSKIYHPDKNIGNNWAAGKYIQITKAYETLTNELARANYEKYGNPDGPSPARVTFT